MESTNYATKIMLNSPMVAKVEVLKFGSNKNRKKLTHIPALDLTATRILEPVIKGRGYKPRSACYLGKKRRKVDRAELARKERDQSQNKKLVASELDDLAQKRRSMSLDSPENYV